MKCLIAIVRNMTSSQDARSGELLHERSGTSQAAIHAHLDASSLRQLIAVKRKIGAFPIVRLTCPSGERQTKKRSRQALICRANPIAYNTSRSSSTEQETLTIFAQKSLIFTRKFLSAVSAYKRFLLIINIETISPRVNHHKKTSPTIGEVCKFTSM